jgi:hypothetical protein
MNSQVREAVIKFRKDQSTENWFNLKKLSKDFSGVKEVNCPECNKPRKWKHTGVSADFPPTKKCAQCKKEEANKLSPEDEKIVNMFNR